MTISSLRLAFLTLAAVFSNLDAEENPSPSSSASAPAAPLLTSPVSSPPGDVRLVGANGREVDFAGIWEARPDGLLVVTTPDAPLTLVAWDRFDLVRLRIDQPSIDAARQRAIFLRSSQPVNLGLFAGLLTPSQIGSELRRVLEDSITVKLPLRYRTTTTSSNATTLTPPRPIIYDGILIPPPSDAAVTIAQTQRSVSETRFTPDELTTSPRRILETLSRTDGIAAQDRRDLFDLVKTNPVLLEDTASALERIAASIPPRHLLPNDPTAITLALRLREFSSGLRNLTQSATINYADQLLIRDLLYLANSPYLQ